MLAEFTKIFWDTMKDLANFWSPVLIVTGVSLVAIAFLIFVSYVVHWLGFTAAGL
jgi:preprotein translocase subunit SecE